MNRILFNLGRIGAGFLSGIALVVLVTDAFGTAFTASWMLIASQMGLVGFLNSICNSSFTREFGVAFQESESRFHKAFASGFGITAGASLAVLLVTFLLTQFLIPKLDVVDGNTDAAVQIAWILTAGLAFATLTSPFVAMFAVQQWFGAWNVVLLLRQCAPLIAFFLTDTSIAGWESLHSFVFNGFLVETSGTALLIIWGCVRNPLLVPRLGQLRTDCMVQMLPSLSSNSLVLAYLNLTTQLLAIVVNMTFGLAGTIPYQYAIRAAGYSRAFSRAISAGIDAVVVRAKKSEVESIFRATLRAQQLATLFISVLLAIWSDYLINLWIGLRADVSSDLIVQVVEIMRWLLLFELARSGLEAFQRVFYGLGHVQRLVMPSIVSTLLFLASVAASHVFFQNVPLRAFAVSLALITAVNAYGLTPRRLKQVVTDLGWFMRRNLLVDALMLAAAALVACLAGYLGLPIAAQLGLYLSVAGVYMLRCLKSLPHQ